MTITARVRTNLRELAPDRQIEFYVKPYMIDDAGDIKIPEELRQYTAGRTWLFRDVGEYTYVTEAEETEEEAETQEDTLSNEVEGVGHVDLPPITGYRVTVVVDSVTDLNEVLSSMSTYYDVDSATEVTPLRGE